jgi:hypothetical protein
MSSPDVQPRSLPMGPRPHTQDPYTRMRSPRGIPADQLVSVLQKEIRHLRPLRDPTHPEA